MRALLIIALISASPNAFCGEWSKLAPLPDKEGFAGPFAGVSNGVLLVAGGANFPNKKPWEGGVKFWHDRVFVLERQNGEWIEAGKLPRPLGYGVSVTYRGGVVCVGGSDGQRHYADAFRLEWNDGMIALTRLSALPRPVANGCGALVGDVLYVAGGQEKPDSELTLKTAWRIDLSATEPKWERIEDCPGSGRMLAVAASCDGSFWLMGGVDLVSGEDATLQRRYLSDAYRYTPEKGWQRVADLPHAIAAAPSPAPCDSSGIYLLGGDDGAQVGLPPDKHRGFSKQIHRYDAKSANWIVAGELSNPRVTVPAVSWSGAWLVPSGEVRPGVRSPEVLILRPEMKE